MPNPKPIVSHRRSRKSIIDSYTRYEHNDSDSEAKSPTSVTEGGSSVNILKDDR